MPLVVDEVVISVEVAAPAAGGSAADSSPPSPEERQALVNECVERVLEILRQKEER
jgi:hypothetical protein